MPRLSGLVAQTDASCRQQIPLHLSWNLWMIRNAKKIYIQKDLKVNWREPKSQSFFRQRAYLFMALRDMTSAATRLNLIGPLEAAILQVSFLNWKLISELEADFNGINPCTDYTLARFEHHLNSSEK
jgi:hypothetical protein